MEKKIELPLNQVLFKEPLRPKKGDSILNAPDATPTKGEFDRLLEENIVDGQETSTFPTGEKLKISAHALKRMNERKLEMDSMEFMKLREAINKLKSKGGRDSLVITEKAAYIVDVEKNTVVTAIAKGNLNENIFTKIDSTVFID